MKNFDNAFTGKSDKAPSPFWGKKTVTLKGKKSSKK